MIDFRDACKTSCQIDSRHSDFAMAAGWYAMESLVDGSVWISCQMSPEVDAAGSEAGTKTCSPC